MKKPSLSKTIQKLTLVGLIAGLGFTTQALAAEPTLHDKIAAAQKVCPHLNCPDSHIQLEQINSIELHKLPSKVTKELESIAFNLAQVWGDTILEGEYTADSAVTLDQVERVTENKKPIGYRITYSSKAWYTGACDYDYENEETLEGCDEGRIIESGFVANDLKENFRDETSYAEFN